MVTTKSSLLSDGRDIGALSVVEGEEILGSAERRHVSLPSMRTTTTTDGSLDSSGQNMWLNLSSFMSISSIPSLNVSVVVVVVVMLAEEKEAK